MPSLDTTNLILAVIAIAALMQSAVLVCAALWLRRRLAEATSRLDRLDIQALAARATALMDDVHEVASATSRATREIERTARSAQVVTHLVGQGLDRATGGVFSAFNVAHGLSRRASAIGAGLREGVRELMTARSRPARRAESDPQVSNWVNEGGRP